MTFYLEGHRPAITHVNNARVLADTHHELWPATLWLFITELAQVHLG